MHARRVPLLAGRQGARRAFASSAARNEKPIMNRYSRTVPQPKTQGASQAMLYATEGIKSDEDFSKAMVGVASVWCVFFPSFFDAYSPFHRYEGNP